MKKRVYLKILSMLFIFALLAGLVGCTAEPAGTSAAPTVPETKAPESQPPATEPPATEAPTEAGPERDESGRIVIDSVEKLELMRTYPDEQFHLAADLDLNGEVWTSIESFSGSLDGVYAGSFNHTLSNFRIAAAPGAALAGFFGSLTGQVSNLNFRNVTLELKDGFSGSAGILAGASTDLLLGVHVMDSEVTGNGTVSGAIGFLAGNASAANKIYCTGRISLKKLAGNSAVGGVFGIANLLGEVESEVDLSVEGNGNRIFVGGIAGQTVAEGTAVSLGMVTADLVYGGHAGIALSGRDLSAGGVFGEQNSDYKVAYSSAKSLSIVLNGAEADQPFAGSGSGKIEKAYVRDISNLDENLPEEEQALRKIVEAYMAEEMTIAWTPSKTLDYTETQYDDSKDLIKQLHFLAGETYFGLPYTHHCGSLERMKACMDGMTIKESVSGENWSYTLGNDCADALYWAWAQISPSVVFILTSDMILENGTIPVGELDTSDTSSAKVIKQNTGEKKLYEAYAQAKMGDALLKPGHVRMVAEAPTVVRKEDGSIDARASYFLIHGQGESNSVMKVTHTTCGYRMRVSFQQLYLLEYIPVTIPEFTEGAGACTATIDNDDHTYKGVYTGLVTNNYRINYVRVIITDLKTQETVIHYTIYPTTFLHNDTADLSKYRERTGINELKKGSYHYELYTNGGTEPFLLEEFDFTVE